MCSRPPKAPNKLIALEVPRFSRTSVIFDDLAGRCANSDSVTSATFTNCQKILRGANRHIRYSERFDLRKKVITSAPIYLRAKNTLVIRYPGTRAVLLPPRSLGSPVIH